MNENNFNSMMNMTDNNSANTMFATENSMTEITSNLEEYKQRLRSLKEVQDLTSEIEVQNPNSIVQFGQKASENISKISDELLNSMKEIKAEETTEMLVNLTKIMDKFDVKEIKNIKQESFVSKIFKSAGNTIAKLFQKYDTMGYEVEKVYVLLKKYESDIKESNNKLKRLYDGNMGGHHLDFLQRRRCAHGLRLPWQDGEHSVPGESLRRGAVPAGAFLFFSPV